MTLKLECSRSLLHFTLIAINKRTIIFISQNNNVSVVLSAFSEIKVKKPICENAVIVIVEASSVARGIVHCAHWHDFRNAVLSKI